MKNLTFATIKLLSIVTLLFCLILLPAGCAPDDREEPASEEMRDGKEIQIDDPWTRPASEGRMSAGYFRISNFGTEADTLTGVRSLAARLTEVHESYEQEGGMVGMREVPELVIPPGSSVRFEPGGLHVMFIQLTESLAEGDEVELILEFAGYGEVAVQAEVRP